MENPHLPRSKLVASAGRDPGTPGPSGVVSNVAPGASPTGWGPQAPKIAKLPYKWFNYGYTMDYGRYM